MKILDGLLEVPDDKSLYVFQKRPEIMEFLASFGYCFDDEYPEHDTSYVGISKQRENRAIKRFMNISNPQASGTYDITEELLLLIDKDETPFW